MNSVTTGSRTDPHAQARHARQLPVLLHSMAVFREIFAVVFAHRGVSTVVEVGVESGHVSGVYAELGATAVYGVEPSPDARVRDTFAANPALRLVERPSPEALADLPLADVYVLDGDHNYAVVREELRWIMTHAPDAVILMHDVLWPAARRDMYYEPSPLRGGDKHPASHDGPSAWHDGLSPAGFIGAGAYTVAERAGGERNGVLTAVEDALVLNPGWTFSVVPAVFGLGILVPGGAPYAEDLAEALRPYTGSELLATMENNRIALYTRVLQQQYDAAANEADRAALVDTITSQQREINRLKAELADPEAEVDRRALPWDRFRHLAGQAGRSGLSRLRRYLR
ncbi:class I SAM-dependent methyltransferase [Actinokineospora auranticolor]|uniref:Methyltransferase family protein n=1 Tax=Actinokineospora auranticolor TaxID=155976 RepID=A0A2S6H1H9_9PSEU|nr:class I SAM-dependent methyltransferase [Actinokineospora auranticolor]PPK71314.1 methyltransferase family protein [Actinokineospora auranticolor]